MTLLILLAWLGSAQRNYMRSHIPFDTFHPLCCSDSYLSTYGYRLSVPHRNVYGTNIPCIDEINPKVIAVGDPCGVQCCGTTTVFQSRPLLSLPDPPPIDLSGTTGNKITGTIR